jgi:ATP-dependent Clp protease ATP-binding subunit ClpC
MFERFTTRARMVVTLAQQEAWECSHDYIGTEHVLLGLLREEDGVAAQVLTGLGVTVEEARRRMEQVVGKGAQSPPYRTPPFTPRTKTVFDLSLREALSLGHNYIGTEHLLLGILREGQGLGCRILRDIAGDDLDGVRTEIARRVSPGQPQTHIVVPVFSGNQMPPGGNKFFTIRTTNTDPAKIVEIAIGTAYQAVPRFFVIDVKSGTCVTVVRKPSVLVVEEAA